MILCFYDLIKKLLQIHNKSKQEIVIVKTGATVGFCQQQKAFHTQKCAVLQVSPS